MTTYRTLTDIPEIYLEALCYHEVFRRCGFDPDDLYITPQHDQLYVVVRAQGKQFSVSAGLLSEEHKLHLHEEWPAAVTRWNSNKDRVGFQRIWRRSKALATSAVITATLIGAGFELHDHAPPGELN